MTCVRLETVEFPGSLQTEFAKLSGDWNPVHVDEVAVRRTAAGKLIVHGMHTVLRALESLAGSSSGLPVPVSIKAQFLKPVHVDDTVDIVRVVCNEKDLQLQALVDGTMTTDIRVFLGDSYRACDHLDSLLVDDQIACRELSLADMEGRSGTIALAAAPEVIAARFPQAVRWLGIDRVAGLLCLSRLVGMQCPGLHSLFWGFAIDLSQDSVAPALAYRVVGLDKRFRLLKMGVSGLGVQGRVEAFVRHPPVQQTKVEEVSALVAPDEFAGQCSLIVGGSRGLGEFTAKLIAVGGGHPIVTYAVGKDDAERVAAEIKAWGGRCDVLKYDVRMPAAQQLGSMTAPVSHVYYYATCPISRRRTRHFDPKILEEFLSFYVRGFYELCTALREMYGEGISAFYPSSVFVEDRPRDMTEYAMAKAAGEILCTDLSRACPGIQITTVRLVRLMTDQTASFLPTETADSVDAMLPIIRSFQNSCSPGENSSNRTSLEGAVREGLDSSHTAGRVISAAD